MVMSGNSLDIKQIFKTDHQIVVVVVSGGFPSSEVELMLNQKVFK